MTDDDLLALNVYMEAGGEPDDGKAAIARVVKNRMARKFFSDGTLTDTILRRDQFSWAYFEMIRGAYTRVCHNEAEAMAQAQMLYAKAHKGLLIGCGVIAANVMVGTYHGPAYDALTDDAVLYLNPRVIPKLPAWASTDKHICTIGHHDFYRA